MKQPYKSRNPFFSVIPICPHDVVLLGGILSCRGRFQTRPDPCCGYSVSEGRGKVPLGNTTSYSTLVVSVTRIREPPIVRAKARNRVWSPRDFRAVIKISNPIYDMTAAGI